MNYITLKAGQTRLKGDEVRESDFGGMIPCQGLLTAEDFRCTRRILVGKLPIKPGSWKPVQLIGHPILQSDLMTAEFRREVAID
jgi:hypothetical protein